ncbi:hypothetical protein U1Q18_003129 [Sarracenia purpurea var. burkii]
MPSNDHQGSSGASSTSRRAILTVRSDQIHSKETTHDSDAQDSKLVSFQKFVCNKFHGLSAVSADEFLSATWILKLLDAFLSCQEEFKAILCENRAKFSQTPLDRLVTEFFDKSIKALDICNATCDGIEKIRLWQKHLEIVLCALGSKHRMIGEGQFRRARKALMELALVMLDEKENGSLLSQRNRSFGHRNASKDHHHRHQQGHSQSLSGSLRLSWSAANKLQSIAGNLAPPRGNEIAATNGLVVPVFTMNYLLMFVLRALVSAIPCQDQGFQLNLSIPRQYSWGIPLLLIHDWIIDESKKRDRCNSNGLLKEIYGIEKCICLMTDLVDSIQFPLTEERMEEVERGVKELSRAVDAFKNGLDRLEREVRIVFCKIISCRTEGLEFLNGVNTAG